MAMFIFRFGYSSAAVSDLEANAARCHTVSYNYSSVAPSPNLDTSHVISIGRSYQKGSKFVYVLLIVLVY